MQLEALFTSRSDAYQLVLHPCLQLGDLGKSVGNLEPLKVGNDLCRARVLVQVDDRYLALISGKISRRRICRVDHGEISQVHSDKR